jgi:ABC transporter with metal-binding/Fe-S-binding domain ATP-binding protein
MKAAVLFSGGKDSNLALQKAVESGVEVGCLVNLKPAADDSFMFHKPCVDLTPLQAGRMGYRIISSEVSGVKEREVDEMKTVLSALDVDAVVSGAVESQYQKSRVDRVAGELGLKSIAPLWHMDGRRILDELLEREFKVMFVGVAAEGLGRGWLGRIITQETVDELMELNRRYSIHLAGEGGEYETLVLDGPLFKSGIKVSSYEIVWDGVSGYIKNVKVF